MTGKDLKNSILQLAIQGKLVEQREEEGSAKELLKKIEAEKKQLLKEGKIKKQMSLPEIKEDEIPFDIPESWEWVKLGSLSSLITKGTTPRGGKVSYLDEGIGFLRAENVAGFDKLNLVDLKFVDENTHSTFLKRSILEENDILITIAGTLGRTAIVRKVDLPLNANQAVSLTRLIKSDLLNLKYLVYAINAPIIQSILTGKRKTTAIPNLTLEIINDCILPIPPLEEQKRIVAKIEKLMPLVGKYDQEYSAVEELNKKFPEDMQKSILQYAIQGKLVEQREEEGTAEELYHQIQEEKKNLVREGKIKKQNKLPEIIEDEIPFHIPDSWKWVRIVDIAYLNSGGQYKESHEGLLYIKVADMNLDGNQVQITTSTRRAQCPERSIIPTGSIIFPKRGGAISTNKKRLVLNENICIDSNTMSLTVYHEFLLPYINLWFMSRDLGRLATGTSVPQINNNDIYPLIVPLPPLEEQARIVAKIEELLPYCKQLIKQ